MRRGAHSEGLIAPDLHESLCTCASIKRVAGCKLVCPTGAPRAKLSIEHVFVQAGAQQSTIESSTHVTPFDASKSLGGIQGEFRTFFLVPVGIYYSV